MINISYFMTADLHLGHPFMAGHRGFHSVAEHDKAVIDGWNSVVRARDVVLVLGDVFWNVRSKDEVLNIWNKKLKGTKILVKGNHDQWVKKVKIPFKRIYNKTIKYEGKKQHIVACHYPIEQWNRKRHGAIHVHGHSHGTGRTARGRLDVGVDVAALMLGDWRPFSFEEVIFLVTGRGGCNG